MSNDGEEASRLDETIELAAYVRLKGLYNSALQEIDRLSRIVEERNEREYPIYERYILTCDGCGSKIVALAPKPAQAKVLSAARDIGWSGVSDIGARDAQHRCEKCTASAAQTS